MVMVKKLSVVFGTMNRLEYLKPCLDSVRASARDVVSEVIVVDGGSADGTLEFLRAQKDVTLIAQGERLGAVRAFCAGFRAATGEYVANLNDDILVVGDTLKRACDYLDAHPKCGQVAIPFGDGNSIPKTQIIPNRYAEQIGGRNLPYANFGVTRKSIGDAAGWWGDTLPADQQLYQYGGDVFLSIKVWQAKYTVDVLPHGSITHFQLHDETRVPNVESYQLDRIFIPHRAWEHERSVTKQAGKKAARAETQREIERERAKRRGAGTVKPNSQPLNNPVRLRYLGSHRVIATFTETPSGRIYRVRLKARQEFYVDSADTAYFLALPDDAGKMFERVE